MKWRLYFDRTEWSVYISMRHETSEDYDKEHGRHVTIFDLLSPVSFSIWRQRTNV